MNSSSVVAASGGKTGTPSLRPSRTVYTSPASDTPALSTSRQPTVAPAARPQSIGHGRTMIIIDHDMDSLFELVESVTVLQEGRVMAEGTPDEIKRNEKVQEAYLGGVHEELATE